MRFFKNFGIVGLLIFSFFLTDFVTELAINSNTLMKTISSKSDSYLVESVNATIDGNTIIPGIKGKKVNEMESYINMKDFGMFNINYLIYDNIEPDISIKDNYEKIIISGNKTLRQVSILIKDNLNIEKYNEDNNIIYTKLGNLKDRVDYKEIINIENSKNGFDDLETLLNKNDLNKKICILNYSNIEMCKKKKYFIIKPSIIINNGNFIEELNNIKNGSIIMIDSNFSLYNYEILLDYLTNKDLKKVYLSKLIEE